MPIDSVNTSPGSAAPAQAPEPESAIDQDAFMRLLITQLRNQDPLSPMEGTEFVQQLSTMTHIEQSIKQSEALDVISLQLTGIASNEAIGLIGKEVTVRGDEVAFDGTNATGSSVALAKSAAEVTVTIRDQNGNAVRTMEMGPTPGGTLAVNWDGRDDDGNLAPEGSYKIEVSAADDRGDPVNVSQDVTGVVVGVTFENGYPEVILGSGARAPISDLISVSQTSGQAAAAASPGRQPGSATTPNHSTSSGLPLSEQLETATTHGIDAAMELIEGEGQ